MDRLEYLLFIETYFRFLTEEEMRLIVYHDIRLSPERELEVITKFNNFMRKLKYLQKSCNKVN